MFGSLAASKQWAKYAPIDPSEAAAFFTNDKADHIDFRHSGDLTHSSIRPDGMNVFPKGQGSEAGAFRLHDDTAGR